ncbi:Tas retrotransposon peptidase A16 [Paramuricea clavata]|uniref:Tas retrotransposon peptidase A16 n=1 Tax=Paramuricea clavata TaxID=317549 RepID=A0A6S7KJ00_PARCT|nr:Tas retrotransposon peptidase A16 [Paramuricea clavata]
MPDPELQRWFTKAVESYRVHAAPKTSPREKAVADKEDEKSVNVIGEGYKLPFRHIPKPNILTNNKSAHSHKDFVNGAISELPQSGRIVQITIRLHVVNPLSVSVQANGKKRLILDLRSLENYWRYLNINIAIFLDDGWSLAKDLQLCRTNPNTVKQDLLSAGFIPNDDKAIWEPTQMLDWLGFTITFVDQARSHLAVLKRYSKGESPFVSSLIYELTDKLPQEDAKAWRTKVGEGQVKMTLEAFSTWLGARGKCYWSELPPQNTRRKENQDLYLAKCVKCDSKHRTENCTKFKELSTEDRFNFVKKKRFCFGCLEESHISRNCPQTKECGIGNCKKKHHPLLHQKENVRSTTTKTPQSGVAFGIVEVAVVGAGGVQVKGNLLFDDGSDTTQVTESFVRKVRLRGKKTTLNISGVGGKENLHVKTPEDNAEYVNLTAWSLPKICQPVGTVQWPDIKRKWKHLENVNLKAVGDEIDILIGLDHADLLIPLDVKMGKPQEPVVKRWMAVGLVGKPRGDIHSYHVARAEPEQLDVAFKQCWDSESFGTKTTNLPHNSNDDQRALDILEHETRKLETDYEVSLLWKENEPQLQNNRKVAQKRLEGLQRQFERDPECEKDYRKAVSKYVEDGYAHKVGEEDDLIGPNQ